MRVEPLTRNIGAQISGVNLGDAARDAGLFAEIKALPRERLPFRSIVAASTNDPLASLRSVEQMAHALHSERANVGVVGHLNPTSGFGIAS